ncbi:single-pass membrane and coiled-coil domain-containing protein 4 homolog isoform X1 [Anoplolepis gracilipes]|uniref:single-pass membrane and coiled-coil domain-containing protein 4 homolog isoform X1 n=2 Tax=Anoplolepis gracilipes TaxID=354296 RepID=UPI003B9F8BAF
MRFLIYFIKSARVDLSVSESVTKHMCDNDKNMRQLKGKTKETNKQKKERKKEFLENKQRVFTVVLPTIAAIFVIIAAYIYVKTRPKLIEY